MLNLVLVAASLMSAQPAIPPADSVTSQPITLETGTGDLAGTLALPAGARPHPVVLIIAGSGPTDRDGNSPVPVAAGKTLHPDSYMLLATALANEGIASVRYDKRGIAASAAAMGGMKESDYRFDNGIADAVAWIAMLRADPRFSAIVIVGHSEGSLIGMIAAQRARVDGFVSLDGAGRPAADVIRQQLVERGVPLAMFGPVLDSLSAGRMVDSVPAGLAALFRPSVQPYLMSWFRYDPAAELKKLPYPTLVIQGSHDVQVSAQDAARLAAAPRAKLLTVDGMTHVLKIGPADAAAQVSTVYSDPTIPIAPQLVSAVVAYVHSVCTDRSRSNPC
jgi:pimeloyl-ACP methyl ester carboxylesterase